jgi:hypothetical protein
LACSTATQASRLTATNIRVTQAYSMSVPASTSNKTSFTQTEGILGGCPLFFAPGIDDSLYCESDVAIFCQMSVVGFAK